MPADSPSERTLIARIAASERWAHTSDRAGATAAARQALLDRFEREVDPEGVLDPAERSRRAASAKSAFYARLSLKSAQARRARSRAAQLDTEVDAVLSELDEGASVA